MEDIVRIEEDGKEEEVIDKDVLVSLQCDLLNKENEIALQKLEIARQAHIIDDIQEAEASLKLQTESLMEANRQLWVLIGEKEKEMKQIRSDAAEIQRLLALKTDELFVSSAEQTTLKLSLLQKEEEMKMLRKQSGVSEDTSKLLEESIANATAVASLKKELEATRSELLTVEADAKKKFASRILAFDEEIKAVMLERDEAARQLILSNNKALISDTLCKDLEEELESERQINTRLQEEMEELREEMDSLRNSASSLRLDPTDNANHTTIAQLSLGEK